MFNMEGNKITIHSLEIAVSVQAVPGPRCMEGAVPGPHRSEAPAPPGVFASV